MKKTPRKKKSKRNPVERYEVIELPADNVGMEKYVETNRDEINSRIVDNIDYALKNKLGGVEIFCFKGSNFVVVLNRKDFEESLRSIYEFSLDHENFTVCEKAKKLLGKVEKMSYVLTYNKIK